MYKIVLFLFSFFLTGPLLVLSVSADAQGGGVPPVITCPSAVTGECGLPVTYDVTAKDQLGNPVPVTCVPPSGSILPVSMTTVVCTARDSAGRSSSCSFNVNVQDTTPPRVVCPADIVVTTTNTTGERVPFAVSCFDQCSIRSLNCTPATNFFPCGTTTVTCVCTDQAGNQARCSFNVTVHGDSCNQCPTAVAKVSPNVQLLAGQTDTIVIAANGSNACVTLDGTMSSDPNGDTLTYVWLVDGSPVAAGAIANTCLDLGTREVRLVVDDGRCARTQTITVDVLTPCEAEGALIIIIQDSSLPRNVQQSLISSVKAACASFERFGVNSGVNQLQAFKNKVRTHVRPLDLALAYQLEAATQAIIDALTGP